MLEKIRRFVAAPVFEQDEDKTRVAALLNTVLYSLIALMIGLYLSLLIASLISKQPFPDPFVFVLANLIFIGLIVLMRLGFVNPVSLALSFIASGIISFSLIRSEDAMLMSVTTAAYFIAITIAGLLSGGWAALMIAVFNVLCLGILNNLAMEGAIQAQPLPENALITLGGLFTLSALLLGLAARSIREALEKARQNEFAQVQANQELIAFQATLEQRVADRTKALATSTEVSRRLSTILNERQLIIEVVERIREAFDYYHVHIYLLDEKTGDLVMAGGTGDMGAAMLGSGHRVSRGKGLVGRAAENNVPVLVTDTSRDPNWLPNPLLPETASEAAVPIAMADGVVGVLDVQHNKVGGLTQEDIDLLQSIANQIAIALLNARSYTVAQQRAEREARITSIGQKIQSTTSIEAALQVAVRELGRTLGASDVQVILDAPGLVKDDQQPNRITL